MSADGLSLIDRLTTSLARSSALGWRSGSFGRCSWRTRTCTGGSSASWEADMCVCVDMLCFVCVGVSACFSFVRYIPHGHHPSCGELAIAWKDGTNMRNYVSDVRPSL